jgi:hypothetical protein
MGAIQSEALERPPPGPAKEPRSKVQRWRVRMNLDRCNGMYVNHVKTSEM